MILTKQAHKSDLPAWIAISPDFIPPGIYHF